MNIADLSPYFFLAAIFLAIFVHSISGSGFGLIAMALLPGFLGLSIAAPLVALMGLSLELILLIRYRHAVNFQAIRRLLLGAVIGVPLGIIFLRSVNEKIALIVLGIVILGYALYALLDLKIPRFSPRLGFGIGFLAGLLGGAYNTSGPPVVIYGNSQGWAPSEFKGNLQSFFILISAITALSHAITGNLNSIVWQDYLLSLPPTALGLWMGLSLDRLLNPIIFRKIVLWSLLLLGVRMII